MEHGWSKPNQLRLIQTDSNFSISSQIQFILVVLISWFIPHNPKVAGSNPAPAMVLEPAHRAGFAVNGGSSC